MMGYRWMPRQLFIQLWPASTSSWQPPALPSLLCVLCSTSCSGNESENQFKVYMYMFIVRDGINFISRPIFVTFHTDTLFTCIIHVNPDFSVVFCHSLTALTPTHTHSSHTLTHTPLLTHTHPTRTPHTHAHTTHTHTHTHTHTQTDTPHQSQSEPADWYRSHHPVLQSLPLHLPRSRPHRCVSVV